MKRQLMKFAAAPILALSLFAAPAMAQEVYSEWDANADASLDANEFNTRFGEAGVYDRWDADADGNLTEEEFNAGVFGAYDLDDSEVLEEPEFGDVGDDLGDEGFWDV